MNNTRNCALWLPAGKRLPDELDDLRSHLEGCPSCRSAAYDFTQISAQGLSQLAAKRLHCEIPSGMTQRFVARARSEGIAISRENVPPIAKPRRIRSFRERLRRRSRHCAGCILGDRQTKVFAYRG